MSQACLPPPFQSLLQAFQNWIMHFSYSPVPEQSRIYPSSTHISRPNCVYFSVILGLGNPFLKSPELAEGHRERGEGVGWGSGWPSALHFKLEASNQSLNFPWRDLSGLIRSKHSLCQIITLFSRQLQNLLYQLARSPAAAVYRWLLVRWLRVCPAEKAGPRKAREGRRLGREGPVALCGNGRRRAGGRPGEWSPRTTLAAIPLF